MDFETFDWDAELKKIILAFEVVEPCEVRREYSDEAEFCSTVRETYFGTELLLAGGLYASIQYDELSRSFSVAESVRGGVTGIVMTLDWDGLRSDPAAGPQEPIFNLATAHLDERLAKALFHLGLLTDEIEAALTVSVSQHQKMEWTLEYEKRKEALEKPKPRGWRGILKRWSGSK